MMSWQFKINIKQFLTEGETKEDMRKCYDGICKEIARCCSLPRPQNFHKYAKMAIATEDVEIFNRMALNSLYDWADEYRVWLGAA